ncbi:MAG: proprotein convertase P-domain-containing protein, partial [Phycisphaerales bacterium]
CTAIAGSVTNGTDCDDASSAISPATVWYQDSDGDGAGDPSATLTQCAQPAGYVIVGGDLCPNTAARTSPATWYPDADGDGFGAASPTQSACTAPAAHVAIDGDCDDANAQLNPNTVWYQDSDGDGAGNPNATLAQCAQPTGYILTAGDTCPNDAAKTSPGTCGCGVADTDSDGDGTADCDDATFTRDVTGGSIPDNSATGLQKTFSVPAGAMPYGLGGVRVTLTNLSHTWCGDVTATLTGPDGTTVSLFTRIGVTASAANGDNSNFGGTYVFDDSFTSSIWTAATAAADTANVAAGDYFASAATTGAKVTMTSAFQGKQLSGTWTLKLTDLVAADTGSLGSARVDFTPAVFVDSDGDGTADGVDGCPNDGNKTSPGTCGCGVADTDSDGDGTPDCNDGCPNDPAKTASGQCGCGVADTDTDGDGTADCVDTTITRTLSGGSIPDNSATGLQRTFALSSTEVFYGIDDIKVTLTGLSHDNLGDLTVQLIGPGGTTASIFTRIGPNDSSNFSGNYAFADAHSSNIWTAAASGANNYVVPAGNYFPSSSTGARVNLTATFASVTIVGTWTVKITDNAGGAAGSVSSVTVDVNPGDPVDSDGDGVFDGNDGCPSDANKTAPGQCGCGVADTDTDGDGVANCVDQCPNDSGKSEPGQCGCGVPDTDSDGDGTANCVDLCPNDVAKIAPGACGCGIADTDADTDGTADCLEVSPVVAMSALDDAVAPGETIVVRVASGNPGSVVVAARVVARYDATRLLFVQAVPSPDSPFTEVNENTTAPSVGTVRHEAQVGQGNSGVTSSANIVDFYFTALPGETICGASALVYFDTIGGESTRFVNQGNNSIAPTLTNLGSLRIDGVGPALAGVPQSRTGAADAGSTAGAYYAPPVVTSSDDCDGAISASLLVTYPNGATASTWPANGMFPVGTTTLTWSTIDGVGNQSSASRTVVVSNNQLLDAGITLGGAVAGNSTRSLRVKAGDTTQTVQVPMTQAAGSAQGVSLPVAAGYNCITVKDTVHSLTSSATPTVVNGRYSASYTLRQGDCNDDDKVDILDFSYFVANRGATVGPNATANFNSDGIVNNADLAFISLSFFQVGDNCGSYMGAPPLDRISVKDLRRMGLGHLAIGDLNGDRVIDMNDIAHYMQFGMPQSPEPRPVPGTPHAE